MKHNKFFTAETHMAFVYRGGESFKIMADDDMWVFVNERLLVDMGGVHGRYFKTVMLDDIAKYYKLAKGKTY
jgi:fibro-slime domain-containing protein